MRRAIAFLVLLVFIGCASSDVGNVLPLVVETDQTVELQRVVDQLQRLLGEWQTLANKCIDRVAVYQELLR